MYAIRQGTGNTDCELYLNTPAPLSCQKDYQSIRVTLGNGGGQESPGRQQEHAAA